MFGAAWEENTFHISEEQLPRTQGENQSPRVTEMGIQQLGSLVNSICTEWGRVNTNALMGTVDNSLKGGSGSDLFNSCRKYPQSWWYCSPWSLRAAGGPPLSRDHNSACSFTPSFLPSHPPTALTGNKASPWPDFNAPAFSQNSYVGDNSYRPALYSQSFLTPLFWIPICHSLHLLVSLLCSWNLYLVSLPASIT